MTVIQTVEWENETTRLVKLDGLARGPNFPYNLSKSTRYYEKKSREIEELIVHHAAGPRKEGLKQATGLASWIIKPKKYRRDANGDIVYRTVRGRKRPRVIGGGRGWPGAPYTFLVPAMPAIEDDKIIVYRLWDDDWVTWHTGKGHNRRAVGVCFGGWYSSRHGGAQGHAKPDDTAFEGGRSLILDYLFPRYGIEPNPDTFLGHFDAGKPACPGDFLENWIRETRGENAIAPPAEGVELDPRPLNTWAQRQQAMADLGFDPGPLDGIYGYLTRRAVEAVQLEYGLTKDGVWGPRTQRAVRAALAAG